MNAAQGQYKVLFHVAAATGLRAGELFGLHVEDLDLKRRVIRIRRSVWRGQEVSPKTQRGYRDVWIDSAAAKVVVDHLGGRTSGRVFQARCGTPLSDHDVLRDALYPICDRLKIKRGGMHPFRHGRVSHLQQCGAPPDFTKKQVGHSSLRTTTAAIRILTKRMPAKSSKSWHRNCLMDSLSKLDSVATGAKYP